MPVLSTLIYKCNAIWNRIARGFLPLGNSTKSLFKKVIWESKYVRMMRILTQCLWLQKSRWRERTSCWGWGGREGEGHVSDESPGSQKGLVDGRGRRGRRTRTPRRWCWKFSQLWHTPWGRWDHPGPSIQEEIHEDRNYSFPSKFQLDPSQRIEAGNLPGSEESIRRVVASSHPP